MLIATKVGNHPRFDGLSAPVITAAVEESLRRLGTDHVDLYFAHYQDDHTPVAESAAAFDALVRTGKIRAVGLSNFDAETVREWLQVAHSEGLAAPVALHAVLPYRSLGGGFLSAKYRTEADTERKARGAGVQRASRWPGSHVNPRSSHRWHQPPTSPSSTNCLQRRPLS